MERVMRTLEGSFLKIVIYGSQTFVDLNQSSPKYNDKKVYVISITPIGTDRDGHSLLCYELKYS